MANLLENVRVDLEISPNLQNLINHNQEIAPKVIKLGFRKVTKEGSKQVKQRIRSMGLVKSGQLAKSVRGSTTNSKSYIGTKLFYANFLEEGADPHVIKPRKKRGSKFLWWHGVRPPGYKKVRHPGIKAYHPFKKEFDHMQSSGKINSLFAEGIQQAVQEIQNNG